MNQFNWRAVVGPGNLKAKMIARELVMHRTGLLERLTAIISAKTVIDDDAAEKAARDYIYRIVEPIVVDPELDEEQPEKKGA